MNETIKRLGVLMMQVCMVGLSSAFASPPVGAYVGGAFDGWSADPTKGLVPMGGAQVTLSSAEDQVFDAKLWQAPAADLTIGESTDPGQTGLVAGCAMMIAFSSAHDLRWDIASLTYAGDACHKVGSIALENGGRYLRVPINTDFATGETLILQGLAVIGLSYARQSLGRLRLDYDGDGIWDRTDERTMTPRMTWSGGGYDGWSADEIAVPTRLSGIGTLLLIR